MTLLQRLSVEDQFDNLEKEELSQETRPIEVKEDDDLKKLSDLFEQYIDNGYPETHYTLAKVSPLSFSAETIMKFSIILPKYESYPLFSSPHKSNFVISRTSHFLNELVSHCPEKRVSLWLNGLSTPPSHLVNSISGKHVIIRGDVGSGVACDMIDGKAEIYGRVGGSVGLRMNGGEIHIYGSNLFNESSPVGIGSSGGKIYHNARLIIVNGRRASCLDRLLVR